jgi:hypothetical protein
MMINIQIINTAVTVQMRTLSVVTRLLCASTSFLHCAQLVTEQKAGLCRKAILWAGLVGKKSLGSATVALFVLFGNLCLIID